MDSLHKIFVITLIVATASSCLGRVFIFDDGQPEERGVAQNQDRLLYRPGRQSFVRDLGNSDVILPPELQPAETRYTWSPRSRPQVDNPAIIWGTVKRGERVSRPQRSVPEEDEEEDDEEAAGYSQEGHSYHHVPASIYSFVKTDPQGNFKWGVHRGPPSRG